MHQEELSTITAPITDDEVFIIEDSFGSGDVFVGDVVNSTESQPTTKVNSTRMATRAETVTTALPPTVRATTSGTVTTPSVTGAITVTTSSTVSTTLKPCITTQTTTLAPSIETTNMEIVWPLIGCSASGWIGVAIFTCYLCKRRRQYTPPNAEYYETRLSPGESLV